MNKVLFNYLFTGYLQNILVVIFLAYCFGILLHFFVVIDFFKILDSSILTPLSITALYVRNINMKLITVIICISSRWVLLDRRNATDLLTMKVVGNSKGKSCFIIALMCNRVGWIILFAFNPIT